MSHFGMQELASQRGCGVQGEGVVAPVGESRSELTRWLTAFMKRAWSSAVHTRRGRLWRPSALLESPLPPSPALATAVAALPMIAKKLPSCDTE